MFSNEIVFFKWFNNIKYNKKNLFVICMNVSELSVRNYCVVLIWLVLLWVNLDYFVLNWSCDWFKFVSCSSSVIVMMFFKLVIYKKVMYGWIIYRDI